MCIGDYVQPTLRELSSHIILNDGTNVEPTKKGPDQFVENIVNLAIKLKRNCDVSISSITARNDQYQWMSSRCKSEVHRKVSRKNI